MGVGGEKRTWKIREVVGEEMENVQRVLSNAAEADV